MKSNSPHTKTLLESTNELEQQLAQSREDIDELVKAITDYVDADGSINQVKFVELIKKHRKHGKSIVTNLSNNNL